MPRDGTGIYSLPASTAAVSGALADSGDVNARFADLEADNNAVRPVASGGTGQNSIANLASSLFPEIANVMSSASAPTPTVPGMLWYDISTTPGVLKVRNVGNTAWEVATDPVIASGVISAGAVSEIAVLIPPEYKSVQIRLRGFAPVTNGASLNFQVGTGTLGSPVWQSANYAQPQIYGIGTTVGSSTSTTSFFGLCGFSSSSAPYAQKTTADLSGFNEAGKFEYLAQEYSNNLTPSTLLSLLGGSQEDIATRTIMRLFASTGDIKNLTYTIIGSAY